MTNCRAQCAGLTLGCGKRQPEAAHYRCMAEFCIAAGAGMTVINGGSHWVASGHEREDLWLGLCWKTRALVDWAGGRPFAWVDDEITDADRDWVAANHRSRALLYYIEPFRGLTGTDFTALGQWLRAA